jgi:hypothetical protein
MRLLVKRQSNVAPQEFTGRIVNRKTADSHCTAMETVGDPVSRVTSVTSIPLTILLTGGDEAR